MLKFRVDCIAGYSKFTLFVIYRIDVDQWRDSGFVNLFLSGSLVRIADLASRFRCGRCGRPVSESGPHPAKGRNAPLLAANHGLAEQAPDLLTAAIIKDVVCGVSGRNHVADRHPAGWQD